RIGRARRSRPGAVLRRVALTARRAADRGRRLEGIGRARAAGPGAELVEVAVARRGAADGAGIPGRVLAGIARAVARVGRARVAVVGAQRPARLLHVGSARLARQSAAALRDVALAGRRPADDADRQEHVGRARGADARTHLVGIADVARTRPADGPGIARRVLASVVRAVAQVGRADVAVVGTRHA